MHSGSGYTNNTIDAGFIYYAALSVAKTSNAGGLVNPGDTIQYTTRIVNNTATPNTRISVTDAVPPGTTFVTGSVTGYQQYEYRDDFATGGGYNQTSGLTDWSASGTPWTETGDDNSPTGGTIQITGNELALVNAQGDTVQRTIPETSPARPSHLKLIYGRLVRWK